MMRRGPGGAGGQYVHGALLEGAEFPSALSSCHSSSETGVA